MQLAVLLAILVSFSAAQAVPEALADPPAWTLLAACLLAAPLATFLASAWMVRGIARDFPSHCLWIARYEWLQRLALGIWLAAIAVAFYGCHWPAIVRASGDWTRWPLAADLATIAPVIATLLLIWTAFWLVERSLGSVGLRLTTYLIVQSRHFLLLPLVPLLLVLGCREALEAWSPVAAGSTLGQVAQGSVVVGLLLLAPLVVRHIWSTSSLAPGELRERLLLACRQTGCSLNDILLWNTGGRMANAAILGFVPRLRYLLLTDALLASLTSDELELVIRHEATHVSRRHLLARLAVLALPLWLWFWGEQTWPGMEAGLEVMLVGWGLGAVGAKLALPMVSVGYAIVALGWLSHRIEHDADLGVVFPGGVNTLNDDGGQERQRAVDCFAATLYRIAGETQRASWLHPAPRDRIAFLDRCSADPRIAKQYRTRLGRLERGLWIGYLAAPVLSLVIQGLGS